MTKAAITLTTGLEDAEKVTVAFLVAVGAAESGRDTLIFLTKESVRLAVTGFTKGTACEGAHHCPTSWIVSPTPAGTTSRAGSA
ncbi:hypothetical protein [Kocuria atrinae]|uniref:hypothetical protein n=1 Tax=Kocuria atrinae TaxID=592377 RepID=UPI00030D35FE|nr:hypothetical protein [Kocuria atrinae]